MIISCEKIDELNARLKDYPSVFVLYDNKVSHLTDALPYPKKGLDISEKTKNVETVEDICTWLIDNRADRGALLLNVGGGILCDTGGFAASIYKRGISYANVPTTLLSQVDAAIGGKTAVNFAGMKNMLGSFCQSEFTLLCPEVLVSLDERQVRSGMAELLKMAIISDEWMMYDEVVELLSEHSIKDIFKSQALRVELGKLTLEAAKQKERITSEDLRDNGERRKLNLGHTFAHAIEALAAKKGDDINHGEAVAMGLVMACELAARKEICEQEFAEMIRMDLEDCGLDIRCPYSTQELLPYIENDKKAQDGTICFVLPADLGDIRLINFPSKDIL